MFQIRYRRINIHQLDLFVPYNTILQYSIHKNRIGNKNRESTQKERNNDIINIMQIIFHLQKTSLGGRSLFIA